MKADKLIDKITNTEPYYGDVKFNSKVLSKFKNIENDKVHLGIGFYLRVAAIVILMLSNLYFARMFLKSASDSEYTENTLATYTSEYIYPDYIYSEMLNQKE